MELGIIMDNSMNSRPDVIHMYFSKILMKDNSFFNNIAHQDVTAESKDVTLQ